MNFHAHVYYDAKTRSHAAALRTELERKLAGVRIYPLVDRPVGPHPQPMFELGFEAPRLPAVLDALMTGRGPLAALVHPVTGNDPVDHTDHAIWLGEIKTLDMSKLDAPEAGWARPQSLL